MTRAEIILWSQLKNNNLNQIKFRRQYGVGKYIVDFYSPALKLAIEVDGDIHGIENRMKLDRGRQRYIESLGIRVLRYSNLEVLHNLQDVLNDILHATPQSLPQGGGNHSTPMKSLHE